MFKFSGLVELYIHAEAHGLLMKIMQVALSRSSVQIFLPMRGNPADMLVLFLRIAHTDVHPVSSNRNTLMRCISSDEHVMIGCSPGSRHHDTGAP